MRAGCGYPYSHPPRRDHPGKVEPCGDTEARARAQQGVFIAASGFSNEARDYVKKMEKKTLLIDGPTSPGSWGLRHRREHGEQLRDHTWPRSEVEP